MLDWLLSFAMSANTRLKNLIFLNSVFSEQLLLVYKRIDYEFALFAGLLFAECYD